MGPALSVATQQLHLLPTPTPQALVSYFALLLLPDHKMMESICLDDESETDPDWDLIEHGYTGPRTPSTVSDHQPEPETDHRPQQYDTSDAGSDEEYGGPVGAPKRKKGGYDSRIEQILYENPDLPILIVDAGKSLESGGKYIVYTIRTGACAIS
jgi:hypothetical protein